MPESLTRETQRRIDGILEAVSQRLQHEVEMQLRAFGHELDAAQERNLKARELTRRLHEARHAIEAADAEADLVDHLLRGGA